eukprot:TRINITY_DN1914_c2_g1_i1.p1 TRINITY_DN1914_c2_g1~~TRINITY_DN1914_c2_g1_i1.p1  ORF type:complete len:377 (-),score=71.22 TRINITY_DN1914_c2_g1_i1:239-1330(-)
MKSIVSLALVVGAAAAVVQYDTEREKMVQHINSVQNTWKAAVNPRFRGMTKEEVKRTLGVVPNNAELVRTHTTPYVKKGLTVPDSFDSATNWPRCAKIIADIRDQSNCGCCWAFGAAEAASARLCIATNASHQVPLSAQDICFCSNPSGCSGGDLATAWYWIRSVGVVTGGQYNHSGPFGGGWCSAFSLPHCHHHGPQKNDPYPAEGTKGCPSQSSPWCPSGCDADAQAPHKEWSSDKFWFSGSVEGYGDEQSIQEAIMQHGPVESAFSVYSDFENYDSGVYKHTTGEFMGGHAIMVVGWGVDASTGTKYWKVANSWNPYWGEHGYFRILRGEDECGIESQATANAGSAKWYRAKGADAVALN